jgi:hypothetical protein
MRTKLSELELQNDCHVSIVIYIVAPFRAEIHKVEHFSPNTTRVLNANILHNDICVQY